MSDYVVQLLMKQASMCFCFTSGSICFSLALARSLKVTGSFTVTCG